MLFLKLLKLFRRREKMKKQIFLITLLCTILVSLSGCQFIPHHYTTIGPTITKNMTQQNFNEIDADVSLLDFNLQVSDHPKVIYHGGKKNNAHS